MSAFVIVMFAAVGCVLLALFAMQFAQWIEGHPPPARFLLLRFLAWTFAVGCYAQLIQWSLP